MEFFVARTNAKSRDPGLGAGARFMFLIAAVGLLACQARAAAAKEYEVKAAFLLNFAQFIQWPAGAFPRPDSPITVGVLGDDPFGAALEQTFQGETVQGRKFAVIRSQRVDDMKACQLVFVCKSEKDQIAQILPRLNDGGIVTVSETDQFVQRGGIINFYLDSGKVRFEINANAAQHKGLKINSQLLKRARIVGSDAGRGAE